MSLLMWVSVFVWAELCLAVAVGKLLARVSAAAAGRVPPAR